MKVDILIIYEHKTRELENACLLMTELKRRGYSVKIVNVHDPGKYYVHPKLMVVPHLYHDWHLNYTCNNRWHDCKCIVDLQYEQVLSKSAEDGIHNPTGQAAFAHHIAWGDLQVNRYLNHGIKTSLIHKTGHLTMDFIKPKFHPFFYTKSQLAQQFNIDDKKDWVLFISSFSYINRSESEMKDLETMSSTARSFGDFSQKSFEEIKTWIKKAAIANPDKLFIYRPHPGEKDNPELKILQSEVANIVCINALAVKQWILASDFIYTWFSTSISEAFYAGKNCQILRPIPIDPNMEVSIMEKATMIKEYSEFEESLKCHNNVFPITEDVMTYAYGDVNTYAYKNISDLCEKIINNNQLQYDFEYSKEKTNIIKDLFWLVFVFFSKRVKLPLIPILQHNRYYTRYKLYNNDMYGVGKLIKKYEKKLNQILG